MSTIALSPKAQIQQILTRNAQASETQTLHPKTLNPRAGNLQSLNPNPTHFKEQIRRLESRVKALASWLQGFRLPVCTELQGELQGSELRHLEF